MNSLQSSSLKISKEPRNNYLCGACSKIYKSYPALFQHIKLKHQGIRPPNTKVVKPSQTAPHQPPANRSGNSIPPNLYNQTPHTPQPTQPIYVGTAQTGRPSKPTHNIDDLSYAELCLEETQNELLGFLGERLMVISGFEDKLKLEDAIGRIQMISKDNRDKWFTDVQNECQALYRQHGENINLDFEEEFRNLNPDNALGALVWFLLWLGKHFVKKEFISDLSIIISKIWKVLESTQLQVQDLDNKLVWKKAMAECKLVADDLPFFRRDDELTYEFIQKLCQLIGKAFEQLA